jgi:hypothetical protein
MTHRQPPLPPLAAEDHVCERCGLDYTAVSPGQAVDTLAGLAERYRDALGAVPVADRGTRPSPDVWSVAEYVCHVRDVFVALTIRLHRVRTEDRPGLEPMVKRPAGRAVRVRRDLDAVLAELADDMDGFRTEVARMPADGWDRTRTRLPHEQRTARWLVRQALHEGLHHLLDVEEVIRELRKQSLQPG